MLRRGILRVSDTRTVYRAEARRRRAKNVKRSARLRVTDATARHPSRGRHSHGLPSRSSQKASEGCEGISPPARHRCYGAASFAWQTLARFTEPKLAEGERRM